MNNIFNKLISRIKGNNYKIDSKINVVDVINICIDKFICLVYGKFKKIGLSKCDKYFFVGKSVKLKHKRFIECGRGVNLGDFVEINGLSTNKVIIGNNVKIGSHGVIRCTGTLSRLGKGVIIGNDCGFDDNCFFGASGGIEIGNNVITGRDIKFHSENHNFNETDILIKDQGISNKGIKVGSNCWIGSNVIFLDGVNVGDGCVIGAGTVVNKDIAANSIAVGNPVRVIRRR